MQFEWDENKNSSNKDKHGLDFSYAKKVFDDINRIKFRDNRKDYGEERWITIGKVLDAILTVVYTIRNTTIRLISARAANNEERNTYNNSNI
jgi:uncharacterized DUF497 family protein